MGLILDSSVLISAERQGQNVRQMLSSLANLLHDTEIAISVITLIELAHGAARADTPHRKNKRTQFIQELLTALPVHPITASIALRAGQIDGKNQAKGKELVRCIMSRAMFVKYMTSSYQQATPLFQGLLEHDYWQDETGQGKNARSDW